ncbi:hypothetical protein [Tenacibaculum caenipelagi]|uniref:Uncharacterized protein n=1 Tax=Tenacibaculum caenipelagi TaxID=1325435 RepID=A0A4R6TMP5_9FLAO|nr:hypothetical protein [Tenacibaculum caenipelagi]TDQ30350.1 hypothetical protein DFQ07_0693 [Tenacibaculum caenipelagi]
MRLFIYLFIYLFISCKVSKDNEKKLVQVPPVENIQTFKWDTVSIKKLPYKYSYDYNNDFLFALTDSLKQKNEINEKSELNFLFSDKTKFKLKEDLYAKEEDGYPYQGKGYFYKRFPNNDKYKVLLFIYSNKEQDYYLPYFELQTIDGNNKTVDKLIVVGGKNYECGWDRSFEIDEDYTITTIDEQSCYDLEEEKEVERVMYTNKYKIDTQGYFKKTKK